MSSSPTKEKTINMVTGVTSAIDCISIEPQCRATQACFQAVLVGVELHL